MSRSRLSPSDDKPLSTKNAKKTTPRTSTSNAGGLGEVLRFVTYSGAESSWGAMPGVWGRFALCHVFRRREFMGSNAGGLGEVRALSRIPAPRVHGEQCRGFGGGSLHCLSRIPAPRVHGEQCRGFGGGSRFVTYSGAESSWGALAGASGLTHRAALGGPLTARELFFRRIGLPPWLVFILLYFTAARVSGPNSTVS